MIGLGTLTAFLAAGSEPEPTTDWTDFAAAIPAALIIGAIAYHFWRKSRTATPPNQRTAAASTGSRASSGSSASSRASTAGRPTIPSPLDILAGDQFRRATVNGQVPPPGPAFANRFLHAHPSEWIKDWTDERPAAVDRASITVSLDGLTSQVLDEIALKGASLPVILAAEHATTLNLTAFALVLAGDALRDLDPSALVPGDGFPGWSDDAQESAFALAIREASSPADAALYSSGSALLERPGDCVRVVVAVMEAATNLLVEEVSKPGGPHDAFETALRLKPDRGIHSSGPLSRKPRSNGRSRHV